MDLEELRETMVVNCQESHLIFGKCSCVKMARQYIHIFVDEYTLMMRVGGNENGLPAALVRGAILPLSMDSPLENQK